MLTAEKALKTTIDAAVAKLEPEPPGAEQF
jgi:hypothetical protein